MSSVVGASIDRRTNAAAWTWQSWLKLTKPRLSALVFCTTGMGIYLGPGSLSAWRMACVLLASAGVVAAANAYNSVLERDSDAKMRRTAKRPVPAKEISAEAGLIFAIVLGLVSMAVMYRAANALTALLAFIAYATYAWVYTPMKRYSWLAVWVGAIPGAIPPMMGWAAVTNHLDAGAWALFALMFCWQLPHFFAIAIYLRHDYARGGLVVLPLVAGVRKTVLWTMATALVLVPASILPALTHLASAWYAASALGLSGLFLGLTCTGLFEVRHEAWARRIFVASVFHLSALLGLMLVEGGGR